MFFHNIYYVLGVCFDHCKVGSLLLSLFRFVYWSIVEFQMGGSLSDLITCNQIDMTIPSTRHYDIISGGHLRIKRSGHGRVHFEV
jgi:hypothetical protein